jgi:hypothetical protein
MAKADASEQIMGRVTIPGVEDVWGIPAECSEALVVPDQARALKRSLSSIDGIAIVRVLAMRKDVTVRRVLGVIPFVARANILAA